MNEFSNVTSKVTPVTTENEILSAVKSQDYVLAYRISEIVLCHACDFEMTTDTMELRAFSADAEVHAVKVGNDWRGRIRRDNVPDGDPVKCYEQLQLIWGEVKTERDGATVLFEDRGITVTLPFAIGKGNRAMLHVRSYLDIAAFAFVDYRICGITRGKAGKF